VWDVIREKKIGVRILLGIFLGVIAISMLLYLVPQQSGSELTGADVVAQVGTQTITTADLQTQLSRISRNGQIPPSILPLYAKQMLDQLVFERSLELEADRLGLRVTDEEARDELQQGMYAATFFPGGKFVGQQQYENILQNADLSVPMFEQGLRDQILLDKLRNVITGSALVTDSDVRREFEKQNTKIKFEYAVLRKDDLLKQINPNEAELKAFYERNKASYNNSIPEKRKVRYVVLENAKIEAGVSVSHEDLQAYYDQHRDDYRVPEQVNVSHILIKTPLPGADGKADPKGVEEARKKAEDVLKQLKGGGNFAELAKKYSEDPGSAKEGGSLGWIGKGRTVPEFEKAAFSQPKGQIGDLVKSSYGFHIMRVDDRQDAHMKTPDEVKDQIEPLLKQQKAQQIAQRQAEALLNQARTGGLDAAAAAKGVPIITSDFVGRKDLLPGLGPATQFMDAVFGATEKSPPDMAPVSQGFAVFQLLAVKPPSTPSFEEIRTKLEDEFKNERSSNLLSQKTQELSDRAKASHDLKKAAKELGATVKTSDFVLPDGQVPDIGSMTGQASVAFSMKPGEISGPINSGSNGVVISILESQRPNDADFNAKRDQIRDSLLQNKQQELFGLFISNLRDQMQKSGKIKINQEEMKTLTRSASEEGM